jgi:hypothetical protein
MGTHHAEHVGEAFFGNPQVTRQIGEQDLVGPLEHHSQRRIDKYATILARLGHVAAVTATDRNGDGFIEMPHGISKPVRQRAHLPQPAMLESSTVVPRTPASHLEASSKLLLGSREVAQFQVDDG